jgi:hypothetical protein
MASDFLKHAPLLFPVDLPDDRPQVPLVEPLSVRQKQNLFLKVGSEKKQFHDLGNPRSRHPAQMSQFRIVPNPVATQQTLKPNGERHEPRDPGNRMVSNMGQQLIWRILALLMVSSSSTSVQRIGNLLMTTHARASLSSAVIWSA